MVVVSFVATVSKYQRLFAVCTVVCLSVCMSVCLSICAGALLVVHTCIYIHVSPYED